MNVLSDLRRRFAEALAALVDDPQPLLEMVRPAQDARFGDYQANCAMPLAKQLGAPPREIAARIVERLMVGDCCETPEIAGPGFINLRLRDDWLAERLGLAVGDERLAIEPVGRPQTIVVDYSSPNVAKPMHVGHIRSTVIGDALCRILEFVGHRVISDNHLGDWGTQFGMIIYGFKHFVDRDAYARTPVAELARLYKLVNRLIGYQAAVEQLPELEAAVAAAQSRLGELEAAAPTGDKARDKAGARELRRQRERLRELGDQVQAARGQIRAVESDPELRERAERHSQLARRVLDETAALHAGDEENRRLWETFLPHCRSELQQVYDRLGITFDHELGESFYQDRLSSVVDDFLERGLARVSDGAVCLFLDGFDTPMIIRKSDGAFLYATTDLATIAYRMQSWRPDVILYVVDFRQSDHFEKLFAAARLWGFTDVDLRHISFGTVLGEDGKPIKTRSGEPVSLEELLNEAVARAREVVLEVDASKPGGPELSAAERQRVAEAVGYGALKYADLSHNRTSDYVFSFDKMLQLEGNTGAYMQYAYARVRNIFAKGNIDLGQLRVMPTAIQLEHPLERALAVKLTRLHEALSETLLDYRPNLLTQYLFELAADFSRFYTECPVLKAETEARRRSRLLLCDLTARTLRCGLEMLGIRVVDKM